MADEIKNDDVIDTDEQDADALDEEGTEDAVIEDAVKPVADAPVLAPVTEVAAVEDTAPAVPVSVPAMNPDGTVAISVEAFNAMMNRINHLEETQKLQLQVEGRNTIQKIEQLRAQGKLVKSVKVRKIGLKYVVGWQTLQDDVYIDENGRLVEKQTVKVFFDDQSDKTYSMRQWGSAPEYVSFEVTGEERDAEGNLFFKVLGPDGKALTLNAIFIN